MKLTICQFGKLFLLLTAFLFASKSLKAAVALNVARNVIAVVDAVERPSERTLVQQQHQQRKQQQSATPQVQMISRRSVDIAAAKQSINNTFNSSSNKTLQIATGQVSGGNTAHQTALTASAATTLNVSLTDVADNDVDGIDPKASATTTTTTTATAATTTASSTAMPTSAHVTLLMGHQEMGNDFLLQQNQKRDSNDRQQKPKQKRHQESTLPTLKPPPSEPHVRQQQQQHQPQPQLQSSYSSVTSSLSLDSANNRQPTPLDNSSNHSVHHHRQQRQQQQPHTVPQQQQPPAGGDATTKDSERVGILVPSHLLNRLHVQQGFRNFMEFFQVNLNNVSVDFIPDDDLATFIRLLEQPNYTTVVKILNAGINLDGDDDDDLREGVLLNPHRTHQHGSINNISFNQFASVKDKVSQVDDEGKDNHDNDRQGYGDIWSESQSANIAYCHLVKALERDFNKTVLLWPCPHMKDKSFSMPECEFFSIVNVNHTTQSTDDTKELQAATILIVSLKKSLKGTGVRESSNFLPSYEAISFAVKSIATKLNWTQVDIFVGDENWALPMAIAANMHIPYRIEIGEDDIRDLNAQDTFGKAIIITAGMNDFSTLRLLSLLESLMHTKVLLIDVVATSFNAENRFYKYLTRINPNSALMSNLLLLTVLSDNYRHFLNVAFDDNGINLVQNFRQQRRWKVEAVTEDGSQTAPDWPIHLDKSVTQVLHMREMDMETDTDRVRQTTATAHSTFSTLRALSEWSTLCPLVKDTEDNLNEICLNYKQCLAIINVTADVSAAIDDLCHIRRVEKQRNLIENLRSYIDMFNFYDFLIANILPTTPKLATVAGTTSATKASLINESKHVPKYDFIVLDVVRTAAAASAVAEGATSRISAVAAETPVTSSNASNGKRQQQPLNNTHVTVAANTTTGHVGGNFKTLSPTNTTTTSARAATAFKWRPLLILEQHEINLKTYITHSIQPGYDDWLLVSTAQLWQCGSICWTIIAICAGVLVIIVVASVAAGIAMRNYLLRKRLSKGPNKIVLSANDFVFPVDSRRVDEGIEAMLCCWLQQLQEFGGPEVDKPDLLKGSIGSLKNLGFLIPGASGPTTAAGVNGKTSSGSASLARHNPALLDMRARYNGDLVQLKEVPLNGSTELKSKAMDLLVMAHGLRHENINPLIGWLADPNRTAMVFDYCSRGSLQDVLIMDEIKLDWSFRLSLLTDLVRGMRYLHTSPLRVHGTLTSRNCVVDARWVLKITDYGLPLFYEAQGLQPPPRTAKEMLWCAPELLRSMKPQHHHHHHHHPKVVGTQAGDVYSFGIIMQEVVVRGEPYCMLSLSAEEIIAKIKKPPPLIRPSVSKGAAPPEAINIMRQCWAEQPDMRPDFNSVYERFKLLNHGRKVNFVDTMFQMLEKYSNNLEELIRERTEQLDIERKKTEQLLNRMLPSSVAEKLKMGLAVEPEEFSDVTIYFSDIVGFTTIAAHCTPVQVVDLLNDLYTIFDATINAYNVYKVETIGDAYMVVSGLPVRAPDHADQIATMALDLLHQSGRFNVKHLPGVPLQLRIGLHTGPCCAGVVGLTMPRYCLFGDTVNTASRMESTGSSWRIHMSQETRNRLETRGGYMIEPRGLIDIKGKGMMNTFWLLGKKGFDKPMPNPPPIGLDESLIRNSITLKAQANKSRNSTNPSSSQSSSLAGESVEVKVEITPPANIEVSSTNLPNSYSLDSNSTTTISPNMTLCPEFPTKTPATSPQSRKITDMAADNLLNPNNFNRLPNSTAGSSSRLYKKIEEMMDLSSPYNHYKCLSPSESNLTQFYDGKYLYSGGSGGGTINTSASSFHTNTGRFEKPGSSRLLRRQFSLDRDDNHSKADHHQHQQHHQSSLQSSHPLTIKSSMLEIPVLHDTARSPKGTLTRVHKQNSNSIAQDLEKIEEIPLSPASSQQHSSLDSNMNRSPPSTVEAQSPPLPTIRARGCLFTTASPPPSTLLSAPASPAPSRSLTEVPYNNSTIMESPTTDASSTATTTASVNSNNTGPTEDQSKHRKTEIMLNVEALLSR